MPRLPYRVVANPPFGSTTELLAAFLDDPDRGPGRLDLILQREVAAKHSRQPPQSLRTAAWAPWWSSGSATRSSGERSDRNRAGRCRADDHPP
ncbi:MAG: hypothetical protein R2713_01520 [Ilumatobacteraceae bacterium]